MALELQKEKQHRIAQDHGFYHEGVHEERE